jgi:hypothetical protein
VSTAGGDADDEAIAAARTVVAKKQAEAKAGEPA